MKVFGKISPGDTKVFVIAVDGKQHETVAVDGQWEIDIPNGLYRFVFRHDQCREHEQVGRIDGSNPKGLQFPDVELEPERQKEKFSVTVKDESGFPVGRAQIQVFEKGSEEILEMGVTDHRGYFECFIDAAKKIEALIYKDGFNGGQPKVLEITS